MVRIGMIAAVALAAALAGCNKPPTVQTPDGTATTVIVAAAAKPAAFGQCAACHSAQPGMNGVGPSLAGVIGRKSGSLAGFAYSDAMKAYGKTWDEATLDAFLTSPAKAVPGTRMTYLGQSDPAQRKAVIDYLGTLK